MPPSGRRQPSRQQHHVPYAPGDVSSITSASVSASAYTTESSSFRASSSANSKSTSMNSNSQPSSRLRNHLTKYSASKRYTALPPPPRERRKNNRKGRGDGAHRGGGDVASDTEVSNLTTSSESSASSGGFLGRLLRPGPKSKRSTTTTSSHSHNKSRTSSSASHDDMDNMTAPSWALSPSISSIPEEHDSLSRSSSARSLHSQSPSHNKPDTEIFSSSHPQPSLSVASPQSSKSLNSSSVMDANASFAMSSSVVSSEFGYLSEETPVIRNIKRQDKFGGDIERGRQKRPVLPTIPSGGSTAMKQSSTRRALADDDDSSASSNHGSSLVRHKQQSKRRPQSPLFCSGKQGAIILCLVCLFIFGVITVIVSFVLSKKEDDNRSATGIQQNGGLQDDDVFWNSNNNNDTANDIVPDGTAVPEEEESLAPTMFPTIFYETTQPPVENPPLSEDDDTLSLIEELLNSLNPSASPTIQPTSTPTKAPTTLPTSNPTQTPTMEPTLLPPQIVEVSGNAQAPTGEDGGESLVMDTASATTSPSSLPSFSPSAIPTTPTPSSGPSLTPSSVPSLTPSIEPSASPTTSQPLLTPETIPEQVAQLWGFDPGDTTGYSVALSGNGQILIVGSPNAAANASGTTKSGRVQIYERQIDTATSRQVDREISPEWVLRGSSMIEGTASMSQLGYAVATNEDGSVVVISEPTVDSRRGRVYIYEWDETIREYVERQVLSGAQTTDHFGISLSLSRDGRRLAVGSPYHSSGASGDVAAMNLRGLVNVYEYSSDTAQWETMKTETPNLLQGTASLDWFGWAIDLGGDGQLMCVGAPRNTEFGGYVQCFQYESEEEVWQLMGSPIINMIDPVKLDDRFGHSLSLTTTGKSADGESSGTKRVAIGSPWKDHGDVLNSGIVAVYEWSDSQARWLLDSNGALGTVIAEDEPGFYNQVGYSLQMEGDTIAVGIPGWENRRGLVNLYWLGHAFSDTGESSSWQSLNEPLIGTEEGDDFGFSVTLTLLSPPGNDNKPSSLFLGTGAIMASEPTSESTGYAKVFQVGAW